MISVLALQVQGQQTGVCQHAQPPLLFLQRNFFSTWTKIIISKRTYFGKGQTGMSALVKSQRANLLAKDNCLIHSQISGKDQIKKEASDSEQL